jgi:fluoride exporter
MSLAHILLVAAGGAAGSVLRHLVGVVALALFGPGFPWGTLAVNVAGSAAMGLLVGVLATADASGQGVRLLLATGVLGGFTTFSTFSLDAVTLWERGAPGAAVAYVTASLVLSLAGLSAGLLAARTF